MNTEFNNIDFNNCKLVEQQTFANGEIKSKYTFFGDINACRAEIERQARSLNNNPWYEVTAATWFEFSYEDKSGSMKATVSIFLDTKE